MDKFSCTMCSGSTIYYATLIAEDEQQAKEMAVAETNKKGRVFGNRPRSWTASVLEAGVSGPARALDCGHREA